MKRSIAAENRLRSYVVAEDSGFAPCVKNRVCTLACCKPVIRRVSREGDWVLGTTSSKRGAGRLVYLMQIDKLLSFADYYRDRRLRLRPDNIYRPLGKERFYQKKNAHHGPANIHMDLSSKHVLVSKNFIYLGNKAVEIDPEFRDFVRQGRGHKVIGRNLNEQTENH